MGLFPLQKNQVLFHRTGTLSSNESTSGGKQNSFPTATSYSNRYGGVKEAVECNNVGVVPIQERPV